MVYFVEGSGLDIVSLKRFVGLVCQLGKYITGDGHADDGWHRPQHRDDPDPIVVEHLVGPGVFLLVLFQGQ